LGACDGIGPLSLISRGPVAGFAAPGPRKTLVQADAIPRARLHRCGFSLGLAVSDAEAIVVVRTLPPKRNGDCPQNPTLPERGWYVARTTVFRGFGAAKLATEPREIRERVTRTIPRSFSR